MKKSLYRSEHNRRIAGVCGGIAEYMNWDVSFIRIAFCLGVIFGGFGLLLYLIMWLVVPTKSAVNH